MTAGGTFAPGATPLTGQVPDDQILVRARQVTKRFGGLVAVNAVDFDIPRGSIVSLIGPNGAGKTTFFNMITGAYVPTSGEISFDGHDIVTTKGTKVRSLKPHQVTALGIGRTFQNIRLFGTMSALDNVLVGQQVHLRSRWWDAILRSPLQPLRGGSQHRARARAPPIRRARRAAARLGSQPAVRRPAPPRDRAGARHESEAPAARRADRRHECLARPAT